MGDHTLDTQQHLSPIRTIPLEILLRITYHLTTTDLGQLRLTCRGLEQSLFKSFTDEFFTRKQFMVSELSLGTLIDISKSRLGWHLRHVFFGLDHFTLNDAYSRLSENNRRRLHAYLSEQHTLWDTSRAHKLLTEAFRNLPNLETVVIRDFNSRRRSRDGPYAQWNSYGARTMKEECGRQPTARLDHPLHTESSGNYVNRLFKSVLDALGTADAKPKAIEIMERQGNRLLDYAFHIPPNSDHIISVLHGLKKLHLCIEVVCVSHAVADHSLAFNNSNLREFLASCPNLEDLRINGHRDSARATCDNLRRLFRWIAAPVLTNNSAQSSAVPDSQAWELQPPPASWPHLKHLSIGMMGVTADDLLGVIGKFAPSLTHLELWRVTLTPPESLSAEQIMDNKSVLWKPFFKKLRDIPGLNLRHVKFGMLQQYVPPAGTKPFFMMEMSFSGDNISNVREYTGPDWRHFLGQEITPHLHIKWSDYIHESSDDEDEDEDEEEPEDPEPEDEEVGDSDDE